MAESTFRREVVATVRVAAAPDHLDAAGWPADATVLRTAVDEVLLLDALDATPPEPHAIVFPDMGWVRFVVSAADGREIMSRSATWPAPAAVSGPALGQGMVAGIPVKLVVDEAEWWFVVQAVVADEFEQRVREVLS